MISEPKKKKRVGLGWGLFVLSSFSGSVACFVKEEFFTCA